MGDWTSKTICFHCQKELENIKDDEIVSIQRSINTLYYETKDTRKGAWYSNIGLPYLFHLKCFEQIAGQQYIPPGALKQLTNENTLLTGYWYIK